MPESDEPIGVEEVLQAIEHLHQIGCRRACEKAEHLLTHTESRVRHRALRLLGAQVDAAPAAAAGPGRPRPRAARNGQLPGRPPPRSRRPAAAPGHGSAPGRDSGPAGARTHRWRGLGQPGRPSGIGTKLVPARRRWCCIGLLPPQQQQQVITTCLHSAEPGLVQAAVRAAAEVPGTRT